MEVMNLSCDFPSLFVEGYDGNAVADHVVEMVGGGFEPRQLSHRPRAGEAVFFPDAIAGDGQCDTAASQEFRYAVGFTGGEMIPDHQRWRIALFDRTVRPADLKSHLRHAATPSVSDRPADVLARCWSSHVVVQSRRRAAPFWNEAVPRSPWRWRSTPRSADRTRPRRRHRGIR